MTYANPCGAKTRSGGQCGRPAGWGTDHVGYGRCKLHGGCVPSGRKAGQRLKAEAEATQAVLVFGLPREVDPHTALVEELARTAGVVGCLEQLLADGDQPLLQQAKAGEFESSVDGVDRAPVYEKPSVWLEMLQRERKHYVAVAKICVDVGIEERRVRLAEEYAQVIARVIKAIAVDMGVADDPRFPTVVRRHLTLVAGDRAA